MKITKSVIGVVAVAGLAFVTGRLSLPFSASIASADPLQQAKSDKPAQQLSAEMEAWIKAGTPGKNHKYLDALVGEWEATWKFRMGPNDPLMEASGTVNRAWILGGRFIKETVEAESAEGGFEGIGFVGFNTIDGQFEMAWLDNHSTRIILETGTYNPETRTLTMRGTNRDPATGRVIPSRGELDMSNPNRHVFTGYAIGPDGKEFKSGEGVAERKP